LNGKIKQNWDKNWRYFDTGGCINAHIKNTFTCFQEIRFKFLVVLQSGDGGYSGGYSGCILQMINGTN
jgi:hypothetical protein